MVTGFPNFLTWVIALLDVGATVACWRLTRNEYATVAVFVIGLYVVAAPRIVNEWDRGILLRLGRFQRILTPGIVWLIPGIDRLVSNVDTRIRSTTFSAERTLTRDTVPVNVDAVLFWVVTDAQKAILEVKDYVTTISWSAQTALRDVIGKSELARMISDRAALDKELEAIIDAKTSEWGITVQSVEIRDVSIPKAIEDAMSRKAQADREKDARIILADSELQVAEKMAQASDVYERNSHAMQLRAMNMTYEAIKEKGALIIVPSGMVDSMNPAVLGLAASRMRSGSDEEEDRTPPRERQT
ncbi:MAG TPA: slipin family protein [Planctomycetota bacterium]|nr:slipin family protein [Planctomycetota bacterium]